MSRPEPQRAELIEVEAPVAGGPVEDHSLRHLLGRLGLLEDRIRSVIASRREAAGGVGSDGTPGFYASHRHVDRIAFTGAAPELPAPTREAVEFAEAVEEDADEVEAAGEVVRLRQLAARTGLSDTEVELLLIAAAPSIDARFQPLYSHLHDDRSARSATVGLALLLSGSDVVEPEARALLGGTSTLVRHGLVEVAAGTPFVTADVVVSERVVAHLLGGDVAEPLLQGIRVDPLPVTSTTSQRLERLLGADDGVAYVRDREGVDGGSAGAAAIEAGGRPVVHLDLVRLASAQDPQAVATAAAREAALLGAGLVVGPVDVLAELGPGAVGAFTELPAPVVLFGRVPWDPLWSQRVVVSLDAQRMDADEHARLWALALGPEDAEAATAAAMTASFRLTPQQIQRAAEAARQHAAAEGRPLEVADLQRGIRAQNAVGLQRLARRIEPRVSWSDLILPPRVEAQLRELPMRWRHRDRVLEDWGMGRGVASGRGVSALFAGGSGTGKTLAAEVIAGELGLDLYLVDLSTVVDKYIGETSKNLERIFDQADRVNGVLLFDEADALFGKRSAVSDSKDRHANVEVAFLLQRMETFDGIAILTTNLAANLDEAFLRRLDAIVDFATPNEQQRRTMWESKLRRVPCQDDVDIPGLAALFTLSGSEISNVVVSAAYHAADRGESVRMQDLVEATVREHRKIGRHLTAADLGKYAHILEAGS